GGRHNGIGVPSSGFDQIFEPFVRLPTPTGVDGAGLGLSLCRRIATLHGGRLEVESSSPEGTTFLLGLRRPGVVAA
ncbi:MAG: sensor histidine kinase, partial [Hydrogenophaga sp.]|nr:sensor histidine kinase [Hydrogenophaga sp.]